MNRFRTPRNRNIAFLARSAALLLAAFGLTVSFAAPLFGQAFARPDGSIPLPLDWSSKYLVVTGDYTPEQMVRTWNEPRVYAQWLLHGNAPAGSGLMPRELVRPELMQPDPALSEPVRWRPTPISREHSRTALKKDWAISLGAGGVAQGMFPAKYSFNVNASPSCTSDFAVFPINTSTGNTRADVVGTFTGAPTSGQTASITITPTGGTAVTLTLTASGTTNTGLDFEISTTAATDAANLAAAINRNLSSTAIDRIVAVASGAKVTVYALTPGTRVTLTDAEGLTNFTWGIVTAGTNGAQANIVAFNHLYSGSGTSLCNLTNPEFIFSYASGVGPVATSPGLSSAGTELSYVENDPNIGAILHVLTFGSGSTEYGTATACASNNNGGATLPTCATDPVIPGSTSGSTAKDFMLPLGLVAANATTGAAGMADSFSSPFTDYANDTTYVGDNNGFLYAITPTFNGTPAYAGGNFPVHVSPSPASITPTQITATATTVTVTVNNSLSLGELVTISGVAANGIRCSAADAAAMNGIQTVSDAGLSGTQFEFDAAIPNATTGAGCNVTNATIVPGSNFLAVPVVDVGGGGTNNIFVGDSSSNLYELTAAGVIEATLALGVNGTTNFSTVNGGIRDGTIIDSTNSVGYVVSACSPNTSAASGDTDTGTAGNPGLVQFQFTSNTLTSVTSTGLDSGANQSCTTAGFPLYAPTPDNRYFTLGIGSATESSNGEIIGASSGTGGQQLKPFSFVSSVLQAAPLGKPQMGNNASVISPLTEFFNSQAFTITQVTATTTTVTVTANNNLAAAEPVTILGVAANSANNCTAADVAAINGTQIVASATATTFTFSATIPTATSGSGCVSTNAFVGMDYLFVAANANPSELYTYALPNTLEIAQGDLPTALATNTTDAVGGTSAMIVDNDSTAGQASSIYFGTLATSTTVCGTTAAYCAVKLTQSGLQ